MKRIAPVVSLLALLVVIGCKHKEDAPAPAASASPAALPSAVATPTTASSPTSASDFEGEIALLAKGKFAGKEATPLSLTLLIKGNRVRADLPPSLTAGQGLGPAYVLLLPAEKKAYAIL